MKQTEIGLVPEDWEVTTLGHVGNVIIGLTYSPNDVVKFGTLVLRSSNIQNNKLSFTNNVFVDMQLPDRVITKENDILICVRNGSRDLIGKSTLIDKNTSGSAFGAFMSIFRSEINAYVAKVFQSDIVQRQIQNNLGATINQITNKDLNSFLIPLPPLPEQEAIAGALSDADAWIESLEQLIAKKRLIKQGAMQELLTPKEGWEVKKLGEVCAILNNLRIPIKESSRVKGDTPYYGANGIQGYIDGFTHFGEFVLVAEDGANDLSNYPVNFVSGKIWVNNHAHVLQGITSIIGTRFLSYLLKSIDFQNVLVGGTRAKLNKSILEKIELKFPSLTEQTRIATILSDMDAELEALEQQLHKARQIKQGMMQELLTGRIRLEL